MPLRLRSSAALVLASLSGCGGTTSEDLAAAKYGLMNSELSGPEEDGVVQLLSQHERELMRCTGALVAANLVLTAKHCVANHDPNGFDCDAEGNLISPTGGTMGTVIAPQDVTIQLGATPAVGAQDAIGAQIFSLPTSTVCRNDIALVLLDRELQSVPIYPLRLLRGATKGESLVAIGYGLYSPDGRGAVDIRHRKPSLSVDRVGRSPFNPEGDDIPPRSFQVNGGSLCMGDSGGPAIAESGAVFGVYSKSNGDCTSTDTLNWYTETAPYAEELIRPAFAAANAVPQLEIDKGAAAGTAGAPGVGGPAYGGTQTFEPSEVIYDRPLPSGGSCRCQTQANRHVFTDTWLLMATATGLSMRRKAGAIHRKIAPFFTRPIGTRKA